MDYFGGLDLFNPESAWFLCKDDPHLQKLEFDESKLLKPKREENPLCDLGQTDRIKDEDYSAAVWLDKDTNRFNVPLWKELGGLNFAKLNLQDLHSLGVCHSYEASPALRLSLLHCLEKIATPRPGEPLACQIETIEAPIAAGLELALHEDLGDGTEVLICSGPAAAPEVNLIRTAKSAPDNVHVAVLFSRVLSTSAAIATLGPLLRDDMERIARRADLKRFAIRIVGDHLRGLAEKLVAQLGVGNPPIINDPFLLAKGASRYAVLRSRRQLPGSRITSLTVDHIYPYSIGILGLGPNGERLWRRLFRSGDCADQSTAPLVCPPRKDLPEAVMLAEHIDCSKPEVEWLCLEQSPDRLYESPLRPCCSVSTATPILPAASTVYNALRLAYLQVVETNAMPVAEDHDKSDEPCTIQLAFRPVIRDSR